MRGTFLLTFLLGLLLATLALLLFLPDSTRFAGLDKDEFAQFAQLTAIALAISAAFVSRRLPVAKTFRDIALWILAGLVLVTAYTFRDDLGFIGERVAGALLPGRPISRPDNHIELIRSQSGSFQARASINGEMLPLLVDTGASSVVLTFEDAKRAGFDPARLIFSASVETANGRTQAAPVRIASIRIGSIVRNDVAALVARDGALSISLLGLSFLDLLSGFSVSGERLILKD